MYFKYSFKVAYSNNGPFPENAKLIVLIFLLNLSLYILDNWALIILSESTQSPWTKESPNKTNFISFSSQFLSIFLNPYRSLSYVTKLLSSTLLQRMVNFFETPDTGNIFFWFISFKI